MESNAVRVYRVTRKKHDQLFNAYVMRPAAAVLVAAVARTRVTPNQLTLLNLVVFAVAAPMLVALPTWRGGLAAIAVLEASYWLDCADGMLARYKNIASKAGHLLDFFTDELKATMLVGALALRAWRAGGYGLYLRWWTAGDVRFLLAGMAGVAIIASALSLTNFVRRPELSGRETTVEAHYETVSDKPSPITTFLRFLNHYPSHIWIWAIADRMDAYMWIWIALNLLYLARGWLGLFVRFAKS